MNLTALDWSLVFIMLLIMSGGIFFGRKQMRSVADYLSANRSAGRYLVSVSEGIAMLGAISIIAFFEQFYESGFTMMWWDLTMIFFILIASATGWIIYRFRETRCMTMAQFFEVRYSKKFRIFAGILSFVSGLINFGIFPAVGARFFMYFCGFSTSFTVLGITFSTYAVLMILLLLISLLFVFTGGQISVIIADFIQGSFVNLIFVLIAVYFLFKVDFTTIYEALSQAPQEASLINPYDTAKAEDFNFWFFLIGVIGYFYNTISWQGTQAYNSSAENAHEAKMGKVLSIWRQVPQKLFYVFIPVVAFTILHSSQYSHIADQITSVLNGIPAEKIQSQVRVPLVLTKMLPPGLIGAFAAVMLGAFISTHDTYLHSWGSIFIQDVLLPFRNKKLKKEDHLKYLRASTVGVAIFIFFFSLLFRQTQYIMMFFAATGAIFVGGAGAVIIGGLYWKKGTTTAAWSALITGSLIATYKVVITQINPDFPINGQWIWLLSMVAASLVYVVVSLVENKEVNLDKILNRGKYKIEDDKIKIRKKQIVGIKKLLGGEEFSNIDRFIYLITYIYIAFWLVIFIGGTILYFTVGFTELQWMSFWKFWVIINVIIASAVFVWFTFGGIKNLKTMFERLNTLERDSSDDGEYSHNKS
ncbi:MAG: sodium:solute symporter [Candidatus Marinimicrobia bacterium]|nr:sodium:solute symporter [Candidatus Neomarinimicrobiota bacterium]